MDVQQLKERVITVLGDQGFVLTSKLAAPSEEKHIFKGLHKSSKNEQLNIHKNFLINNLSVVKPFFRNGTDISPDKIDLELREVKSGSLEEVIFKWWNLVWWSVPYQRAYGRQIRFILWDKYHDAPFGLIGLQSPVLKISVRDEALSIPKEELDIWVNRSMQAQRLGALPPYNDLIGGKMVALAVTSKEISEIYTKKYSSQLTLLKNRKIDPDLLFITTTSAFGRSSIYNRLKYHDEIVAKSLGFTKGVGTFHIPENLYSDILEYLDFIGLNTERAFGTGPSRRIKLLSTGFRNLGLPNFTFHNIKREFFLFPLVKNLELVISNKEAPVYFNRSLEDLQKFWMQRWCIPRSESQVNWNDFTVQKYLNNFFTEFNINFEYEP